jgi:hypothetical protein
MALHRQWIGTSGKGFGLLKQAVKGLIPDSCIWKNFGWEGRTPLVCPTGSPDENLSLLKVARNFVPIKW